MASETRNISEDFEIEATEGFDPVLVPEDVYVAKLTGMRLVKDVEVERDGVKQKVDMLEWDFTLPDGVIIQGTSTPKFTPKSKAMQWAISLGVEIESGDTVSGKDLIGKSCQIVVKTKEKSFNNEKFQQSYIDSTLKAKEKAPEK